jgi:hypothetical protein
LTAGTAHPVATLGIVATNVDFGETASSAQQSIVMTDPPVVTASASNVIDLGSVNNTIITPAASTITAGGGNDKITLTGTGNFVTLNGSTAAVANGQGHDTIVANGGKDTLTLAGPNSRIMLNGPVTASIADLGNALQINIGSSAQTDTISGFGSSDTTGVIDLLNRAGGFSSVSAVIAALHNDGHGGTILALGTTGSIDFTNAPLSHLSASNFKIA